ncbi:T9SS type A sorting domain-containing protein [uncultured Prevotella sp.]|uniref:T9SS type A sorting domain-containing protein n=1 Tax=uncultured Prevotella sp. TaxID=159272 RepID=UPI0026362B48|nr:T9SS type A sorting domain-containing protein [uncultured Prevotella sp.]
MIRNSLFILCASLLLSFTAPSVVNANSAIEIIDVESQSVSISVSSSSIRVVGANGQMLYIYNVAGVKIMSIKIDSSDRCYDLNLPKGCYIVKVGKVVRKISVK